MLASQKHGTLYIGSTTDLARRMEEHRSGVVEGFTARYSVYRLVHAEFFEDIVDARARERAMKKWRRAWKIELIEAENPDWRDLTPLLNR
ncbi:MAG: GIY-YIG nuclease family protein [Marivibrio sp.]|uniref:GIY-YIG nuclease family protein n=1 Tax=Marivibrio sp. TaxID=2039719 RepID=UPI0032EDD72E